MIDRFRNEYAFLSNFYPSPIHVQGLRYPTVEHAFQAAKTDDPVMRERVRRMQSATSAKRLGRSGDLILIAGWDDKRIEVMHELLILKFAAPTLQKKLIGTSPKELIEGNTWGDKYWGAVWNEALGWQGENNLGKLLMELRNLIIDEYVEVVEYEA